MNGERVTARLSEDAVVDLETVRAVHDAKSEAVVAALDLYAAVLTAGWSSGRVPHGHRPDIVVTVANTGKVTVVTSPATSVATPVMSSAPVATPVT